MLFEIDKWMGKYIEEILLAMFGAIVLGLGRSFRQTESLVLLFLGGGMVIIALLWGAKEATSQKKETRHLLRR